MARDQQVAIAVAEAQRQKGFVTGAMAVWDQVQVEHSLQCLIAQNLL